MQKIIYFLIKTSYYTRGFFYSFFLKRTGKSFAVSSSCFISGLRGISVGDNITIQFGTVINGNGGLVIESDVLLAHGVKIYTENHIYENRNLDIVSQGSESKPVFIGKGSWICANVIILPGVSIGKHSVVAAGSVVTKDVPDYSVVAGVPAKIIKMIN
ncbi:MAG: acyltransferase [Patescibacteria group bacterium]